MSISEIKTFQDSGWEKPSWLSFSKKTILKIIDGKSILDVGCGDGLLLEELLKVDRTREIIGLDISDKAVERARTEKGLDCRIFDITQRLPFEDNHFDSVLLMDVLEHMFMPESVLKEAVRVTRGNVYVSVPNFVSLPARFQVLFGKVPENNTPRKGHTFWFTRKVLHNLIKKCGLVVELEVTNTFWENKFILGKLTKFLSRVWPESFALSFIIKAKKNTANPTKEDITGYYDDLYKTKGKDAMRPLSNYQEIFKYFGPVKTGGKLLDVGCGTGLLLKAAKEKGLEVYGVDISSEAVKVAQSNVPNAKIMASSGEELPFDNVFFDYVVCLGSLEHFLDLDKAMSEMIRVAKKDAVFLIVVPNQNYWFWRVRGEYGTKQIKMKEILMDLDDWESFLQARGLIVKKVFHDPWSWRSVKIFKFKNPWRILRRTFYHFIWLFVPVRYTYQFCFICNKKT